MSRKVFNNLARGAGIASAGVIFALAGSPAWAATCEIVPPLVAPKTTPDAAVAVASNFFVPMKDLIKDYFTKPGEPGAGLNINVCHDSTGILNTAITGGNPDGYSLFLAANTTTPTALQGTTYVQTGAMARLYAKGVPVLFAPYVVSTMDKVSDLVTQVGTPPSPPTPPSLSGVSADIPYNDLSAYTINIGTAAKVAVANPKPAPYGNAAFKIMSDQGGPGMGLVTNYVNPGDEPPAGTLPFLSTSYYTNIDLTFQSVLTPPPPPDTQNTSGFVSKAQICGGIGMSPPTYIYAEFTGSNYLLEQSGILIKSGDPITQDPIGADILQYMLDNPNPSGTFWSTFLTDHCYKPL